MDNLISINGIPCTTVEEVNAFNMSYIARNINSSMLDQNNQLTSVQFLNYAYSSLNTGHISYKVWLNIYHKIIELSHIMSFEILNLFSLALQDTEILECDEKEQEQVKKYKEHLASITSSVPISRKIK